MSELPVGTKLLGHLVDFDPDSPETQVMLERTPEALNLTLAWNSRKNAYARWFSRLTIEAPFDGDEYSHRDLPTQLLFQHTGGSLFLLGCEIDSAHMQIWGSGTGTIRVKYAIENTWGITNFERANGVRSEITGLRRWLGISSVTQTFLPPNLERGLQATYVAVEPKAIVVGGPNGLRLVPTWLATPDEVEDSITLRDRAICETTSLTARDWDSLLSEHRALRDLLVLSSWTSEEVRVEGAYLLEPPELSENGEVVNTGSWYGVQFASSEGQREPSRAGRSAHLIEYADLGPEGISRWLELRKTFARAVDPIVSSKIFEHPSINVHLSLAGMGAEALGYLIAIEAGRTAKQASDIRFADRLKLIGTPVREVLPFDLDDWVVGTSDAYNAIKHANRELIGLEEMVLRWRQTVMMIRVWVACRLGVEMSTIAKRLETDLLR